MDAEPCLFVLHCSAGLLAILVWVDDILVACSKSELYKEFRSLYEREFPSKHHDGANKFAGVSIDYQPGVSLTIHQQPHIEMAYDKYVVDKVAASRSAAVSRPAISDRDSPYH